MKFHLLSGFAIEGIEPGALHGAGKCFSVECTQLSLGYISCWLQVAVPLSFGNPGAWKSNEAACVSGEDDSCGHRAEADFIFRAFFLKLPWKRKWTH